MKKILLITYYWPPSGGGGVQRWLKFSKYLPENGWEPVIFTPENPEFELKDNSLFKDVSKSIEVIKLPIWEPFGIYKKLFSKTTKGSLKQGIVIEKSKQTFGDKLSIWIRANLFIPDPRRFWVMPSVKFLKDFVIENDINHIVTTGPPHSMHLIGLGLKKHHPNIKWVADFRDPWSDWDILEELKVSNWAMKIHKNLETKILRECDVLLTTTQNTARLFENKKVSTKVECVTNGYDESDFNVSPKRDIEKRFRISHMGLLNEMRNPKYLWLVLSELCDENKTFSNDLEITLAGTISNSVLEALNANSVLSDKVNNLGYISHQEVVQQYFKSSVLLLLQNQSGNNKFLIPAKLFEYLYIQKPILCLGEKDEEVSSIIKETNSGHSFNYDEKVALKAFISEEYINFKNNDSHPKTNIHEKYSRKNLTEDLVKILKEI